MRPLPATSHPHRSLLIVAALILGGCASPSPRDTAPPALPTAGLIVGSVSYPADLAAVPARVRFERLQTGDASAAYSLMLQPDPGGSRGSFVGFLPEGVYRFRLAESPQRVFVSTTVQLPFEVSPGEVRNAGQYALQPVTELGQRRSPTPLRTGLPATRR